MKRYIILKYLLITLFLSTLVAIPLDQSELFHKNQKIDKLVIKNHIGYHFKKIVREVSQELFISRKVDVSALFAGLHVLQQAQIRLGDYCTNIETMANRSKQPKDGKKVMLKPKPPRYEAIALPPLASFAEARAICEQKNMRLPEVYQSHEARSLGVFLVSKGLPACFAGLAPDPAEAVFRFISTGIPVWKGPFSVAYDIKGKEHQVKLLMDDVNVKFAYSNNGTFMTRFDHPSPINTHSYGSNTYRDQVSEISEITYPVVCEEKWNGEFPQLGRKTLPDTTVKHHRKKRGFSAKDVVEDVGDIDNLKEYCRSVVALAEDTRSEMFGKLTNLLSLVDISVHMENNHGLQSRESYEDPVSNNTEVVERPKRVIPLFLAKAVFITGFKLIWGLYGIIDKMRTEKRLKKMEKNIANVQAQASMNSNLIRNLSQVAYGNSIAIQQLNVTTRELQFRVANLENRVNTLEVRFDLAIKISDADILITLVASLIERIRQSMDAGYDVLKDIIHCSLLGQTSPLLLPLDQIDVVQNKVRKVSTSILDPDFVKMQSIIVSDPNDPHLLLVIINAAALSREEMELVELIPIPYYEGGKAFFPILDYKAVVLNQLKRSYSVLQEPEEISCLSNRCYVSDVERPVSEKTCGIPQFFDEQLDACIADEMVTTGVFLKPMLPDGILFAFQEEVTSQLFCSGATVGPSKKLTGTGIMQLPNGCILSLVDKRGVSTKVKGPPIYRMLDADDLALIVNGPLSSTQSQHGTTGIQKKANYDGIITNHLSSVFNKMQSSDHRLDTQTTFAWGLLGALVSVSVIVVIIIFLLYKYSTRFRQKIRDLKERFAEVSNQVANLVRTLDANRRGLPPPTIPLSPHVTNMLQRTKARMARVEAAAQAFLKPRPPSPMVRSGETSPGSRDSTYISYQPGGISRRGSITPSYPQLSPQLQQKLAEYELKDLEMRELNRDSEEVSELASMMPPSALDETKL
jgi:hypothetical protein